MLIYTWEIYSLFIISVDILPESPTYNRPINECTLIKWNKVAPGNSREECPNRESVPTEGMKLQPII